jgi:hypothetical protein
MRLISRKQQHICSFHRVRHAGNGNLRLSIHHQDQCVKGRCVLAEPLPSVESERGHGSAGFLDQRAAYDRAGLILHKVSLRDRTRPLIVRAWIGRHLFPPLIGFNHYIISRLSSALLQRHCVRAFGITRAAPELRTCRNAIAGRVQRHRLAPNRANELLVRLIRPIFLIRLIGLRRLFSSFFQPSGGETFAVAAAFNERSLESADQSGRDHQLARGLKKIERTTAGATPDRTEILAHIKDEYLIEHEDRGETEAG